MARMGETDSQLEHVQHDEHEAHDEGAHPFWPHHVLDQVMIFYLLIGVLLTLSILVPFHLHEPADPLNTPEGIKPEWYFLSMYQSLKYIRPELLAMTLSGIGAVLLLFWPFVDAALERRFHRPRLHRTIGAAALVVMVLLGVLGYVSDRTYEVGGQRIEFDIKGVPHLVGEAEPGEPAEGS